MTPHHLLLTEHACEEHGTNAKMNPPLRTEQDIRELKAAIADGTITILGTDHAPHPPVTKDRPFGEAFGQGGAIGGVVDQAASIQIVQETRVGGHAAQLRSSDPDRQSFPDHGA